jgi:amidase
VVEAARPVRRAVVARTSSLLAEGTVLVLPTTPRSAPLKGSAAADTEVTYRHLAMNLLCTAGLAGLPQVSLPLAQVEGAPLGLSLVGRHGSDLELVTLAAAICAA